MSVSFQIAKLGRVKLIASSLPLKPPPPDKRNIATTHEMETRTMASSPKKMRSKRKESEAMLQDRSKATPSGNSSQSSKRQASHSEEAEYYPTQVELAGEDEKPKKTKKISKEPKEEKRLRRYRKYAPASFQERLQRVRTQRMFLIDRERKMSEDGLHEIETFDLAGSTGNLYKVTVDKAPSCNCPDALKGNFCKHIIYVRERNIQILD